MDEGIVPISICDEKAEARNNLTDFGWEIVSVGDNGTDGHSDLRIMSWTGDGRLVVSDADRNQAEPEIFITAPVMFQKSKKLALMVGNINSMKNLNK